MLTDIIERARLPFRKDKKLRLSLYRVLGFYPHDTAHYELALRHKSMSKRDSKGRPLNNERLEFLGDAVLDAAVGAIVYEHFPGKREGFLTSTRSKLVKRDTLNRLAEEVGLMPMLCANSHNATHNSYLGGNAFEALVGAIYIDRGYNACMRFLKKRILKQLVNIDKIAYKDTNYKSKLIEWCQKNRVKLEYKIVEEKRDNHGNTVFKYTVLLGGVEAATGTGYSKRESQQRASKLALAKMRKDVMFLDKVFASKETCSIAAENRQAAKTDSPRACTDEVCVDPEWKNVRKKGETGEETEQDKMKESIVSRSEEAAYAGL